ncbi:MAG TPA: hypothetical protein VKN35_06135, partial [Xanthomonadales bacterium]|nr:hypothetical protein [Xanthomonadales bacterium]
ASDNVYAGADGNVYKKTDDGWEKYDSGSWNPVDKPSPQQSANQRPGQSDLSGATKPQRPATEATPTGRQQKINRTAQPGTPANAATGRFQGPGTTAQLDQDHQSRLGGAQRQQQFDASRSGRGRRARN